MEEIDEPAVLAEVAFLSSGMKASLTVRRVLEPHQANGAMDANAALRYYITNRVTEHEAPTGEQ